MVRAQCITHTILHRILTKHGQSPTNRMHKYCSQFFMRSIVLLVLLLQFMQIESEYGEREKVRTKNPQPRRNTFDRASTSFSFGIMLKMHQNALLECIRRYDFHSMLLLCYAKNFPIPYIPMVKGNDDCKRTKEENKWIKWARNITTTTTT